MAVFRKLLVGLFMAPVIHRLVRAPASEERPPIPGSTILGWGFLGLAAGSVLIANRLLPPSALAEPLPDTDPRHAADLGVAAKSPADYSFKAWKAIGRRVWLANNEHNISLMSAGVAFYAFLSFVPLLGALVMSYGLVADPATVARHMKTVIDLVPADAARLIYEQLVSLTTTAASRKGFGLLIAIAVSIYGASRASGAIMSALNVIYGERDRRGLVRGTLISAVLVIGAVATGILGVLAASMLGFAQDLLKEAGPAGIMLVQGMTWLVAAGICCVAIGAMYRFAPDRADARWQWLSAGSLAATILWLVATLGFAFYAAQFANYNVTYGSLGAVVVLLMWLYVSSYAILIGGVINAETERQTAHDSTTGRPRQLGRRGATVADMSSALDERG